MTTPSVSVIINTWNRAAMLDQVLASLCWQGSATPFELIVVNGPSTDHTDDILQKWAGKIRPGRCAQANLSASRNVGIRMSAAKFVVFIDDDAYPEPEWLEQMLAPFADDNVAAVGGIVYDHTGTTYQYEYRSASRLLNCNWAETGNGEHLCFPFSLEFPYPPGGNAAYRRAALIEVGGFDEEIEYYGDETDVALRLVDAGYLIRNIAGGYVHHKSAPSNIRSAGRVVRHWYPILKNKMYFALKNGRSHFTLPQIIDDNRAFCAQWEKDVRDCVERGVLGKEDLALFEAQREQAWERALMQGLAGSVRLMDTQASQALQDGTVNGDAPDGDAPSRFLPFAVHANRSPAALVLVSQHYPPTQEGGIPTLTRELGEALAASGRIVHVVTQTPDIARVDLEQGVWVHRVVNRHHRRTSAAAALKVPQRIWDWSASARDEVERIALHRPIEAVEAPVWDCQGVAFLANRTWPLITSLMTTLHFWLESHAQLRADRQWMADFGTPMLALEQQLMQRADGVRSISAAIRREIEAAYHFRFDDGHIAIAPLGMAPLAAPRPAAQADAAPPCATRVLFVGRLEERKGIDVLLAAVPLVLARHPHTRFRLLGDDALAATGSSDSYKTLFLGSAAGRRAASQVRFEGRVDLATLHDAYRWCDLFVAPSRFESFGLVFLEAMREGKAVIGCRAGGMPEIIRDGETGLLVAPGDAGALAAAICRLIDDPAQRRRLGAAGQQRYERDFTAASMAGHSLPLYAMARRNHAARHGGSPPR